MGGLKMLRSLMRGRKRSDWSGKIGSELLGAGDGQSWICGIKFC